MVFLLFILKLYKGVYTEKSCDSETFNAMNHCVSIVGYGFDNASKKKYWILRNQWGTSWGMNGYMLLEKVNGNQLCIASELYVPVVF